MKPIAKIVVLGVVILGIVAAVVLKEARRSPATASQDLPRPILSTLADEEPIPPTYDPSTPGIPRLVALGAGACIPCKAMAPIRAELRREYAGVLAMDFYDVWKDPQAGHHFRIWAIPTLIFYDAAGQELARREGFIAKAEILSILRGFGIDLQPTVGA
jgi:thioredoxin 1